MRLALAGLIRSANPRGPSVTQALGHLQCPTAFSALHSNYRQGRHLRFDLNKLITISEPENLDGCSLPELREIRDHYQNLENGLSYARRIVQGRLDTVTVELDRRTQGVTDNDVLERLPDALAAHSRGPGLPRPVRDVEPPEWADEIVLELDEILTPSELGQLTALHAERLTQAALGISELEKSVSKLRHEMHDRIDRVQDELIGRYQSGASVDDLLR